MLGRDQRYVTVTILKVFEVHVHVLSKDIFP